MFAGILYGAMYGGSTTVDPAEHAGRERVDDDRPRGEQDGQERRGAAALATAAIGSFVAGTLATMALTFLAPAIAELAFLFGPQDYFALIVWPSRPYRSCWAPRGVRGFISCSSASLWGGGNRRPTAQPACLRPADLLAASNHARAGWRISRRRDLLRRQQVSKAPPASIRCPAAPG